MAGRHPAVIYSHGTVVRKLGYGINADSGHDVADFVNALVKVGYVAVAPIRQHARLDTAGRRRGAFRQKQILGGPAEEFDKAVGEGIAAIGASVAMVKARPDVDGSRVGVVGFSGGGNITLWSSLGNQDFGTIVLMSPVTLGRGGQRALARAADESRLKQIRARCFSPSGKRT